MSRAGQRVKIGGAGLALAVVYWLAVRRWFSRWGTTPEELARVMPGDALIPDTTDMSMQAITINAPPEDIWPWLVQIGYQRGGLYSYDWLDRLFGFLDRPSAVRILPEFQQLAVGDKVPWGRTGTELTVGVMEPVRALALSYEAGGFAGCGSSVCIRSTSNEHGSSRAAQSVSHTHRCGGWACASWSRRRSS